jgi:hypothetical protein
LPIQIDRERVASSAGHEVSVVEPVRLGAADDYDPERSDVMLAEFEPGVGQA